MLCSSTTLILLHQHTQNIFKKNAKKLNHLFLGKQQKGRFFPEQSSNAYIFFNFQIKNVYYVRKNFEGVHIGILDAIKVSKYFHRKVSVATVHPRQQQTNKC